MASRVNALVHMFIPVYLLRRRGQGGQYLNHDLIVKIMVEILST